MSQGLHHPLQVVLIRSIKGGEIGAIDIEDGYDFAALIKDGNHNL
jgi:hypothetical protein